MENNAATVSILTATMNAFGGLKTTVESVHSQTCPVVEHIIVDGGSTDGTREWLETLGDSVRWISEPDDGIADALNKAVAMASGNYLLVLHAEDAFLDNRSLELALSRLAGGEDIVSFDVLFQTAKGDRRLRSLGFSPKIFFKTTLPHQGVLCRRDLFSRIGPFDPSLRIEMDYDFFLRARLANASVRVVPKILSRMPDTGISSRTDWPSLRKRFAEEQAIHRKNVRSACMRIVYSVYWPLYLSYRCVRALLAAPPGRRPWR